MQRRKMASSTSLPFVRKVAVKQSDGSLGTDSTIGAAFTDVIDADRGGATGYSLDQFFDSYIRYMNNADFVYMGDVEPQNEHIKIWIDTSSSNQD